MHHTAGNLSATLHDTSEIMAAVARYAPEWEIITDHDGWHAIPSPRLAFHGWINRHQPPDIHSDTPVGLLGQLQAWTTAIPAD